jgi:hypothetical protein
MGRFSPGAIAGNGCGGGSGGDSGGGLPALCLLKNLSRSPVRCILDWIRCRFRKKRLMTTIKKRVQKIKDAGFLGGGVLVFRFLGAATV